MSMWEETWAGAVVSYLFAATIASQTLRYPSSGVPLMYAGFLWLIPSLYEARDSARRHTVGLGQLSAALRFGVVGLPVLSFLCRWQFTAWLYAAEAALIAGTAIVVSRNERQRTETGPRYGYESMAMACFAAAYVIAMTSLPSVRSLLVMLIVHSGMLTVALIRNSHVVTTWTEGAPVRWWHLLDAPVVWTIRAREPGGAQALRAALALPSGIAGTVLVAFEVELLIVLIVLKLMHIA